jgi:hypothetical protein
MKRLPLPLARIICSFAIHSLISAMFAGDEGCQDRKTRRVQKPGGQDDT